MYGTCGRIDNKADFDFDFDLINSLSCIVCNTFLLPLHVSSIFSTAKETLKSSSVLLTILDLKTSFKG